jgi:hypothetical protein
VTLFNPPAFLDDFARRPAKAPAFAEGWDAVVNLWFDTFAGVEGGGFYNPARDDTPGLPDRQSVAWDAFPHPITKWFEGDEDPDARRWRAADTLRPRLFGGRQDPARRAARRRAWATPATRRTKASRRAGWWAGVPRRRRRRCSSSGATTSTRCAPTSRRCRRRPRRKESL